MARDRRQLLPPKDTYARQTLRPLNCLAFLLPLLTLFHVGTAVYGTTNLLAPHDVFKVLQYFGATIPYLPAMLIVVVLLVEHVARRERWKLNWRAMAGMAAESVAWILPLIALGYLTGSLMAHEAGVLTPQAEKIIQRVLIAVGAGVYEEFIFRLVLIGAFMLLFVDVFDLKRDYVAVAAVITSAALFSLYHFSGAQFDRWSAFPMYEFIFRALAGMYLGAIFVFRGLGIAVGVHVVYNLYVTVITP